MILPNMYLKRRLRNLTRELTSHIFNVEVNCCSGSELNDRNVTEILKCNLYDLYDLIIALKVGVERS